MNNKNSRKQLNCRNALICYSMKNHKPGKATQGRNLKDVFVKFSLIVSIKILFYQCYVPNQVTLFPVNFLVI